MDSLNTPEGLVAPADLTAGAEDLRNPQTARYYEKYYAGAGVSGVERLRALSLVRNLVASEFSAYQEVLAVHAEGSLEAEKQMVLRSYDGRQARDFVRRLIEADVTVAVGS